MPVKILMILCLVVCGSPLSAMPGSVIKRAVPALPNIIFILADDMGWGDLGCYGNKAVKTPNIDGMARQGTLFTQYYVNGSVCSPSRAAIFTGQYPARNGIHEHLMPRHDDNARRGMPDFLDPVLETIPKQLKKAGYATAHFGKWHLGSSKDSPGLAKYGVDVHKTQNSAEQSLKPQGDDPFFIAKSTGMIVDETIKFIKENREKPFFVNLWTLVPHAVLNPTQEQMDVYKNMAPDAKVKYSSPQQVYFASVTNLDEELGRLFKTLDEMGLSDNTIVLFSSDNGPEEIAVANASHSGAGNPGPFRGRKRSLYEGGIRVPFIVRWPGHVPANRIDNDAVLTGVDMFPTFSSLAKVPLPEGHSLNGEDVSDILMGKVRARSRPLMWEGRMAVIGPVINRNPTLAIRDKQWKLLMNADGSRIELYHITDDPTEVSNVAFQNAAVVKNLTQQLAAWKKTIPGSAQPGAGQMNYNWPKAQKL